MRPEYHDLDLTLSSLNGWICVNESNKQDWDVVYELNGGAFIETCYCDKYAHAGLVYGRILDITRNPGIYSRRRNTSAKAWGIAKKLAEELEL